MSSMSEKLTVEAVDNESGDKSEINTNERNNEEKKSRNDAAEVRKGKYDAPIISAFRCNHFDLRQLTSGINYKQYNSIYHKVAKFIGLSGKDDDVAVNIYQLLKFNKRGIRDKIDDCECCKGMSDYADTPISKKGDTKKPSKYRINKVTIDIVQEKYSKPPPVPSKPPPPPPKIEIEEVKEPEPEKIVARPNITQEQEELAMQGKAIEMTCPRCGETDATSVQFKIGIMAVVSSLALTLLWFVSKSFS